MAGKTPGDLSQPRHNQCRHGRMGGPIGVDMRDLLSLNQAGEVYRFWEGHQGPKEHTRMAPAPPQEGTEGPKIAPRSPGEDAGVSTDEPRREEGDIDGPDK